MIWRDKAKKKEAVAKDVNSMVEENVKVFAAKFGEQAERTIPDKITVHNWPYGKPNKIFSVGHHPVIADNIFASTVKGVSYLGNIDDFNMDYIAKSDEFLYEIPMGYTSLDINERLLVYEKGEEIWKNKSPLALNELSEEELKSRKLDLYVLKNQEHYAIFLPDRSFDGKFCIWMGNMQYPEYAKVDCSKLAEVCALAKQYSKETEIPCLVTKRVYSCNWH